MNSRLTHSAQIEDAIVQRLEALANDADLDRFDLRAAPAQQAGWKSHSKIACRVIWMGATYTPETGVGGNTQRRTVEILLSWRFHQLAELAPGYAYMEAARLLLNGWKPRLAADAPPLGDKLACGSERHVDVDGPLWTYEQRFTCSAPLSNEENEALIADAVTRITQLDLAGDDFDPPADVPGEAA